jgi:hypothetical protein
MKIPNNPFREVIVFAHKTGCLKEIYFILPLELEENNRILHR